MSMLTGLLEKLWITYTELRLITQLSYLKTINIVECYRKPRITSHGVKLLKAQ